MLILHLKCISIVNQGSDLIIFLVHNCQDLIALALTAHFLDQIYFILTCIRIIADIDDRQRVIIDDGFRSMAEAHR